MFSDLGPGAVETAQTSIEPIHSTLPDTDQNLVYSQALCEEKMCEKQI
jgi:hypothetical protein